MNIVEANYNMTFEYGSFHQGQKYKYWQDTEKGLVYVITEQGKEQDFYFPEFDALFTLVEN